MLVLSVTTAPSVTVRVATVLLKIVIYGYLKRVPSSQRLEWEASRNVALMWLTGRLVPDQKTIAKVRMGNGRALRKACTRFVALCREMNPPVRGQRCDQRQ